MLMCEKPPFRVLASLAFIGHGEALDASAKHAFVGFIGSRGIPFAQGVSFWLGMKGLNWKLSDSGSATCYLRSSTGLRWSWLAPKWLKIPNSSNASMPDGTQYADVTNSHNYVQGHGSSAHTL